MIKLNTEGEIISGDNVGWFVKIEDDKKTGGYYIYQYKYKGRENGLGDAFDDWLESLEDVKGYLEESGWIIKWSE